MPYSMPYKLEVREAQEAMMARTVRDMRLNTRSARLKLAPRREPYWRSISQGLGIGYRRGKKGGTWIAKHYTPNAGRRFNALGTADDVTDADGTNVLDFGQAQEKAREWFAQVAREDAGEKPTGPYTVQNAIEEYLDDYKVRSGRALREMEYVINAHILPELGDVEVVKLTAERLRKWHNSLATTPARLRTAKGGRQRYREAPDEADTKRQRKVTANKILTILRSALNHAYTNEKVASDDPWRRVKPFKAVDEPTVKYLTESEAVRLINACPPDFRQLVKAALVSGCRYGELTAMMAADFDPDAGNVLVRTSKSGKARHVTLTDEGCTLFEQLTAGRPGDTRIFIRDNGKHWGKSHQIRLMDQACKVAGIRPAISFHILRHCVGSWLAMRGVPMGVIARQLGHTDQRMAERHYAHLAPSYVADIIRANLPQLSIVKPGKVARLGASRA